MNIFHILPSRAGYGNHALNNLALMFSVMKHGQPFFLSEQKKKKSDKYNKLLIAHTWMQCIKI